MNQLLRVATTDDIENTENYLEVYFYHVSCPLSLFLLKNPYLRTVTILQVYINFISNF